MIHEKDARHDDTDHFAIFFRFVFLICRCYRAYPVDKLVDCAGAAEPHAL
tara:strand:+ start:161 stop:310 length:150 start_codon:yes stop_codon:yes gene_type:complete